MWSEVAHFFFRSLMSSIQALRSDLSPLLLFAPPPLPLPPRPALLPPPPALLCLFTRSSGLRVKGQGSAGARPSSNPFEEAISLGVSL